MISLSATAYDPNGRIILNARPENSYDTERRGEITATLDGGSWPHDGGWSVSDLTLRATLKSATRAQLETLRYLAAYYPELITCCETGVYRARLTFSTRGGNLSLQLRLLSRLDA